jgi:hypothetical protein
MPLMMVWPVSSSVCERNEGSSSASFCSVSPSFCDRDHWLREVHAFQDDRVSFFAERVARRRQLQTQRGTDVTGLDVFDVFALVRVHQHQAADALALLLDGVHHRDAAGDLARVHAQEGQLTDERIVEDLERQRRERRAVAGFAQLFFTGLRVLAFDGRDVSR